MSNLKKLLALESRLEELVKPKHLNNMGLIIPPETKEEALQKMIEKGLADPSATIDDVEWLTVNFVSAPPRDAEGNTIAIN